MAERLPEATNQPRSARERRRLHLCAAGGTDLRSSYEGIGAELKAVRLRHNLRLSDVAAKLRIREVYLAAIEEGRFVDLPGPVYATGFVRTYGEFIGFNGDDCVTQLKREDSASERTTKLNFPIPSNESRLPGRELLAVSLAIAIGLYAAWYYGSNADRVRVEGVPAVPERLMAGTAETSTEGKSAAPARSEAAAQARSEAAASARSEAAIGSATAAKPTETAALKPAEPVKPTVPPAVRPTDAGATKSIETTINKPVEAATVNRPIETATRKPVDPTASRPVVTAGAKPPASGDEAGIAARRSGAALVRSDEGGHDRLAAVPTVPESRTPASGGYAPHVLGAVGASRVTLIAKVDSWVQIRGTNSELLLTRVLRAGDRYHVPNRTGLILMTGNAGAIEVAVDGKSLPPLGPVGEVRRDVSLDPDELLKGAAAN